MLALNKIKHMKGDHMEKEILTIEEAAEYLQIGKRSIYKLAKEGKIPGKKVLNKWRFEKESLRMWVSRGEKK
jgi:excisionase family DNA binding protein